MISLKVKKIVCEIFALGIVITERTEYDCFIRFSAHVNTLNVELCNKKDYNTNLFSYSIRINEERWLSPDNKFVPVIDLLLEIRNKQQQLLLPNVSEILEDAKMVINNE